MGNALKYHPVLVAQILEAMEQETPATLEELTEICDTTPSAVMQQLRKLKDLKTKGFSDIRFYETDYHQNHKTPRDQRSKDKKRERKDQMKYSRGKANESKRILREKLGSKWQEEAKDHLIDLVTIILFKKPVTMKKLQKILHEAIGRFYNWEEIREALASVEANRGELDDWIVEENGKLELRIIDKYVEQYLDFLTDQTTEFFSGGRYRINRTITNRMLDYLNL